MYVAVGESVTLSCHFNLAPEDLGVLDIEWSIKSASIRAEEITLVWYSGNRIYSNFRGRVQFVSPDPASGNASISISNLTTTDTDTYQCKVRKRPGFATVTIHLDVMERPTKPECYAEGVVELDRKVVFRCGGAQGSPPIWYSWSMDGKRLSHDATIDSTQGDLVLPITKNIVPGTLVCTAHNLVGVETCPVTLSLDSAELALAAAATAIMVLSYVTVITAIYLFWRVRQVCNVNVEFSTCECGSQ